MTIETRLFISRISCNKGFLKNLEETSTQRQQVSRESLLIALWFCFDLVNRLLNHVFVAIAFGAVS
jgi:hypothetical protein